ncbi:hypothetical protein GOP47_0026245, partial [Adiantum capillus-veneris]
DIVAGSDHDSESAADQNLTNWILASLEESICMEPTAAPVNTSDSSASASTTATDQ